MTHEIQHQGGAARLRGGRPAFVSAVLLLLAALLPLFPAAAHAQTISGQVVRDGRGVAGAPVQVHRVTREARGVVAEGQAGPEGAFSFALPPADTAGGNFSVVFATSDFAGVRYFGPVLHAGEAMDGYRVELFDTTTAKAAADSVRVMRRDLFLVPLDPSGWEVAELVTVSNGARRTVLPAGDQPLVGFSIPAEATDFESGGAAGDSAGGADVVRMGERVWLTAPLQPGVRELVLRYRIPGHPSSLGLALAEPTDSFNLYVRQPAPEVTVRGLGAPEPFQIEGEQFQRFAATGLRAGTRVGVDWRGPRGPIVDPRLAALGVAALVLAAGAFFAMRRRGTSS